VFSRLHRLCLETSELRGSHFIRSSSFPRLEKLITRLEPGKDNMIMPIDKRLLFPPISSSGLLMLDCFLPVSWAALSALKGFVTRSVQPKYFRFDGKVGGHTGGPLKVSYKFISSLRDTLSMFHPVILTQRFNNHQSIWFLLMALNLDRLQRLNIEFITLGTNPLFPFENSKFTTTTIKAPSLSFLLSTLGTLIYLTTSLTIFRLTI